MTQLTRKQQSGIQQLLEKERNERLYGRLPNNSPTEILNILGANKETKGGFMDMLHDLFIGTKRTEFPEVPELTDRRAWEAMGGDEDATFYGGGDSRYTPEMSAKIGVGRAVTEDDYQLAGIVKETFGNDAGVDFWRDKYGNTVLTLDGADFYLNKPGLSVADMERLGGQLASYSAGSRFYAYGNMLKRMLGSMFAFTGVAATRDVGSWSLGGPQPEAERAVLIGALGALGVPVIHYGGLLARGVYNKAASWFKGGSLSPEAIRELEKAGMDVTELEPQMRRWFNEMERKFGTEGAVSETVARSLDEDLTVPLTAGEKSQRTATQQQEYLLSSGARGSAAQDIAEAQRTTQAQKLESAAETLAGGATRDTALSRTLAELGILSARDHQAFKVMFGDAERTVAFLPTTERQVLRDQVGFVSGGGTLEATNAYGIHMSALDDVLAASGKLGIHFKDSGPTIGSLFQWRSEASKASTTLKGTDNQGSMALGNMVRNFDDYIDDLITKGSVLGNPKNIQFWQQAVNLRRKFGKNWQATTKEDPNFLASQVVDSQGVIKLMPDEAANVILNTTNTGWLSKPFLNRNLLEIKKRLGVMSDGWRGIRDEVVLRMIQNARNKSGDFVPKTMLGFWYKLKRENPGLLNTMFDIKDQQMLSRFLYNSARVMKKQNMGANFSNTSIFQNILGRAANIPGINLMRDVGAVNQANKLLLKGQMEAYGGKSVYPGKAVNTMLPSQAGIQTEPVVQEEYPNVAPAMVGGLLSPFLDEEFGGAGRGSPQ
jgi:hypothetical protein